MQTNEEIRKEFEEKLGTYTNEYGYVHHIPNYEKIVDFWLNKMNLQKQQMVEKGERLTYTTMTIEKAPRCDNESCSAKNAYNQAITDYQNLIKGNEKTM